MKERNSVLNFFMTAALSDMKLVNLLSICWNVVSMSFFLILAVEIGHLFQLTNSNFQQGCSIFSGHIHETKTQRLTTVQGDLLADYFPVVPSVWSVLFLLPRIFSVAWIFPRTWPSSEMLTDVCVQGSSLSAKCWPYRVPETILITAAHLLAGTLASAWSWRTVLSNLVCESVAFMLHSCLCQVSTGNNQLFTQCLNFVLQACILFLFFFQLLLLFSALSEKTFSGSLCLCLFFWELFFRYGQFPPNSPVCLYFSSQIFYSRFQSVADC